MKTYKKIVFISAVVSLFAVAYSDLAHATAPLYGIDSFAAASVSTTEIDLSWSYQNASLVDPAITGYKIERESPIGAGFTTIATSVQGSSYANTNLSPNTVYNYRISAINADGASATRTTYSATAQAQAQLSPPDPPQNMTASGASGFSISLSWTAAPNSPTINGYRVERTSGAGGYAAVVSSTSGTSYTDANLSPNSNYGYRVVALSNYGESNSSLTVYASTFTLPGPVQSASAVSGNGQATVNWTTPYFTGGEITGYLVEGTPSVASTTAASTARSAVITGLMNGLSYTFTVTPVNSLGRGAPAMTNSVVPSATPVSSSTPAYAPPSSTPAPPPAASDAQSLQNQLNALLLQLQQLQTQTNLQTNAQTSQTNIQTGSQTNSATSSQTNFTRNLYVGVRGDDVATLQKILIAQNKGPAAANLAAARASGYFGSLTQKALAEFQTSVGISPASGYFGPKTRGYVSSLAR